jgi:polyhydroxyalkanoate synthase
VIDVGNVGVPVLVVAGSNDVLAPREAVHHVAGLLGGSPEVRVETAKGGHLGVLTGRSAVGETWRHLDDFLRTYDRRREALPEAAAWLPTGGARKATRAR